jgi:hypothetical protein
MKEEKGTIDMYSRLREDIDSSISRGSAAIADQITLFEKEKERLIYHLDSLEDELSGWKFTGDLAKQTLSHLHETKSLFSSDLLAAQTAISPVRKIPKEIWGRIFRMCVEHEFDDYVKRQSTTPFRCVPLALSRVCQTWRNLVLSDPSLWKIVTAHPSPYITEKGANIITYLLERVGRELEFVLNLSQSSHWDIDKRLPSHHSINRGLQPNEHTLPRGLDYTVYLVMNSDTPEAIRRIAFLPFPMPRSVKVHVNSKESLGGLYDLFGYFRSIQKLELTCSGPHLTFVGDVSRTIPSLHVLNLYMEDMPDFDAIAVLNPDLVELRIRHNGKKAINIPGIPLVFPKLKLLGVNYPSSSFLETVTFPILQQLELYDSDDTLKQINYREVTVKSLANVHRVVMEGWKKTVTKKRLIGDHPSPLYDAVSIFSNLARFITKLDSVHFSNCNLTGRPLIDMCKSQLEDHGGTAHYVKSITLSGCRLITYAECEELKSLVSDFIVDS